MTLAPMERPQAVCQGQDVDPDWWTSSDPAQVTQAVKACGRCPEEQACLVWALKTRQRGPAVFGGVWFGRKRRAS